MYEITNILFPSRTLNFFLSFSRNISGSKWFIWASNRIVFVFCKLLVFKINVSLFSLLLLQKAGCYLRELKPLGKMLKHPLLCKSRVKLFWNILWFIAYKIFHPFQRQSHRNNRCLYLHLFKSRATNNLFVHNFK